MDTPVDDVAARGRKLRHRRTAVRGLATASAAAVAALAIALPSSGGGTAVARPQNSAHSVNVDLAGWSVHTNPTTSVVTLTLREMTQPDLLRQVLAEAGVRAVVQDVKAANNFAGCTKGTTGVELPQFTQVFGPAPTDKVDGAYVVVIKPAAMPAGSTVSIVVFDFGRKDAWAFSLSLVHGTPPTCVPMTGPTEATQGK